jgi:hypothetical protein
MGYCCGNQTFLFFLVWCSLAIKYSLVGFEVALLTGNQFSRRISEDGISNRISSCQAFSGYLTIEA